MTERIIAEPGDIVLVIRPDGQDSFMLTADTRDVRLWERIGPRNTLRKLVENPSTEDYYSLAHIAIKRQRLREVPPLTEFIETTVVAPQIDTMTSAGLSHDELVAVLEKAMSFEEATPATVADTVLDLLEALRDRSMDPTQPGR